MSAADRPDAAPDPTTATTSDPTPDLPSEAPADDETAETPDPLVPDDPDERPAPDADPSDDPRSDPAQELSADITALDDDATPAALDDSSSVVESDLTDEGTVAPEMEGGEDEHAEQDAIEDLPDERDGRPETT